ncbi:MAG: hypothetical protein BWZ00_01014 [Bacteroidetes bacterium ADurb.BinA174]|nr:MAG: hypothetical protein BWZ00_01014 [Bacteroidetes bacterium ADurb.BinA174]
MKDKNNNRWLAFLGIGTMFFIIGITRDVKALKYTLLILSIICYIASVVSSIHRIKNQQDK